jgi:hypothetical protein
MLPTILLVATILDAKPVTHTIRLRHVLPSRMSERLLDPRATHPLSEALEQLSLDDKKKTITLKGSAEAVEQVEQAIRWLDVPTPKIEVEIEAEITTSSKENLRGRVLINTDACGTLVLSSRQSHVTLQIVPHLNRNKTCSLAISVIYQKRTEQSRYVMDLDDSPNLLYRKSFPSINWLSSNEGRFMSGLTSLKLVPLGKTLKLDMGILGGLVLRSTQEPYSFSGKGQSTSYYPPILYSTPNSLVAIQLKITPRLKK